MDTVVFIIPQEDYKIIDPSRFKERFEPLNYHNFQARKEFASKYKCVKTYRQNPSVEERRKGIVYPNLTIYERLRGSSYTCDLHVSVSLSKLLYGHSFKDVYTEQMNKVTLILVKRLYDMGVLVKTEDILKAAVNTMHYSSNITFPSEHHARMFLDRLNNVSIGNWFEKNERHYSNDGHAVRFHSNIFQIVFYLKYYDLNLPKSRCVDRRRTLQEEEIAKKLKDKNQIPPLVRLEIRFAGKRSLTTHLDRVIGEKKSTWTFQELFSTNLSRKVLLYYWNKIISDPINRNLLCTLSDYDTCQIVLQKFKGRKVDKVLSGLGIFYLLHSLGVKDVRELMILRKSRASWYRERRNIVTFINRYVKSNTELIDIVTKALVNDTVQLEIEGIESTL